MRLVLDTCVVVAGIRSETGASRKLLDLASMGEFTPVLSGPLVAEYEDVIHRPENQLEGWTREQLSALIDSLLIPGEWATTHFSYRPILPDPADELVLEAAINGHADIVSFNEKHFKPASRFGIRVLRPVEALEMLGEGEWLMERSNFSLRLCRLC
jgi:predicted nucleic acid-binding protein